MKKAILLFAHGARDPLWAQPIEAIRSLLQRKAGALRIECAYLEFIPPLLPDALERLAAEGFDEIVIVPMFMAQTGHTKRDLPALLAAAQARQPGLHLRLAGPIGEAPEVMDAIARYALGA